MCGLLFDLFRIGEIAYALESLFEKFSLTQYKKEVIDLHGHSDDLVSNNYKRCVVDCVLYSKPFNLKAL